MTPSAPHSASAATHRTTRGLGLSMALLAGLVPLPAAADWLVMEDGSRVETRGPWSVEGRQVLFTLPNGTLSALRASEVDLPASEALTEAKVQEKEAAASAVDADVNVPDPVWTFNNSDIPQAVLIREDIEIDPLVGAEGFSLQDVQEQVDATGDNLVVRGTLINDADIAASLARVRVLIVSPVDGGTLDVAQAVVNIHELLPRSATRFTASFENLTPGAGVVQIEVEVTEGDDTDYLVTPRDAGL